MSTEAKAESNRKNSQRSTGPRTTGGKLRSGQNARKIGVYATQQSFATPDEKAQFEELCSELKGSLRAKGAMEKILVERIARCEWELTKVQEQIRRHMAVMDGGGWSAAIEGFMQKNPAVKLPFLGTNPGTHASDQNNPAITVDQSLGWEGTHLLIRVVGADRDGNRSQEVSGERGTGTVQNKQVGSETAKQARYELEVKMENKIERLRRNENDVTRRYFQFLSALGQLRKD